MDFDESAFDVIYYATKTCPFSQRVRSVLEAKQIKYKFVESVWSYDHSTGKRVVTKEQWFKDLYATAIGRNRGSEGQSPMIKIVSTGKVYTDSLPCCRALEAIFKDKKPSVIASDDIDSMVKNEIFNGYITGSFAMKARFADKDGVEAFKAELKVLDGKMCEYGDKDGDKYIFGDGVTLSDICLLPTWCRINARVKYQKLEFDVAAYVKKECARLSKWSEFIMAQQWAKNVMCPDEDYVGHFVEVYGK